MSGGVSPISDYDFIFKIVVIGDSSVGKSNLLLRFTRGEFRIDSQATIGVEFAYKQVIIDGKRIKTQIWDTAGQERFKTVIPQFYRGCEGALVVFDITKFQTFNHVENWVDEVHRHAPPQMPIVLVGNKSDLVDQRAVTRTQAIDLAEKLNLSYMETSALNASNVEEAFHLLVNTIYQKRAPTLICASTDQNEPSVAITKPVIIEETKPIDDKPLKLTESKKSSSNKKNSCCVIS